MVSFIKPLSQAAFSICVVVLFLIAPLLPSNASDRASELVAFNVSTFKVHKMSCTWAARCTKNCITIPRAEAYKRGGVPCKVCGG